MQNTLCKFTENNRNNVKRRKEVRFKEIQRNDILEKESLVRTLEIKLRCMTKHLSHITSFTSMRFIVHFIERISDILYYRIFTTIIATNFR